MVCKERLVCVKRQIRSWASIPRNAASELGTTQAVGQVCVFRGVHSMLVLLGCIERMRCWPFLQMFAVSVSQSVCLSCSLNRQQRVHVRHVACVWGHLVQPTPNAFGLLFQRYVAFSVIMGIFYPAWNRTIVLSRLDLVQDLCINIRPSSLCHLRESATLEKFW